jgi:hypothetical protein
MFMAKLLARQPRWGFARSGALTDFAEQFCRFGSKGAQAPA